MKEAMEKVMKTLLITGGSRGIGYELIQHLKGSYHIINVSRSLGNLKEGEVEHIGLDLSKPESFSELEKSLKGRKIDVLINNAGGGAHAKVQHITFEKMQEAVNLNLNAAIMLSKIASKLMIQEKSGAIINMVSVHGLEGNPNSSLYSASKFGLRGFSEALHYELKKHRIKVTAIYPDLVDTELLPRSIKGRDKFLKPKDIASVMDYLLNLPEHVVIKDITLSYL